jgi:hypothetical protein
VGGRSRAPNPISLPSAAAYRKRHRVMLLLPSIAAPATVSVSGETAPRQSAAKVGEDESPDNSI